MTVFPWLVLVLILVPALLGAKIAGWAGLAVGAAGGLLLSLVGIGVTLYAVSWTPRRPVCRRGACCHDDYEPAGALDEGLVFSCRCEDRYVMHCWTGLPPTWKFEEVRPDQSRREYAEKRLFSEWTFTSPPDPEE